MCKQCLEGTPIDVPIERHPVRRMETVTVSPKLQVIIPQKIRDAIGLRDGDKIKVVAFRNRIELPPCAPSALCEVTSKASTPP